MADNGPGFDREDLPLLFQRFYRGNNACKDSIGIGLALSKALVERQNGTLRAENAANGGACFTARFIRTGAYRAYLKINSMIHTLLPKWYRLSAHQ